MSALRIIQPPSPVYKFKESARIPKGVTVGGVLAERERIVERFGRCTASEAAGVVLAEPESFASLRAFGPENAEDALRLGMERGIRYAFSAIVKIEVVASGKEGARDIEIRLLHAVPTEDDGLSYEPLDVIRHDAGKRSFLIAQLRKDAHTFAEKLEAVLSEIESLL